MEMRLMNARWLRPLLATLVLAAIVTPVAIATAQAPEAGGSAAKKTMAKQLKALKKQTAALVKRVSALEGALAARPGAPAPQVPASLPPSGAAGGDLAANYPNPQIRANAILSTDIAAGAILGEDIQDGAITGVDIADGSIGAADLAANSVHAGQLGNTVVVKSLPNLIGSEQLGGNEISCPENARLIGGGVEWRIPEGTIPNEAKLLHVLISAPRPAPFAGMPADTWEVGGENDTKRTFALFAKALCLET
jgi:hypothetical protein